MSLQPLCVRCKRFMRCHKNGRAVEILSGEALNQPYQLWSGDEWRCEECGITIVAGFGHGPVAEAGLHAYYPDLVTFEAGQNNLIHVRR